MDCFIALGTNLGHRLENLDAALRRLASRRVEPLRLSSVWETEPVDSPAPYWFWNMVLEVRSALAPEALLAELQAVERDAGRRRDVTNGPRTLDVDLLLMGDLEIERPGLVLPHPRMWTRRFVLEPLAEIAPDLRDPANGSTVVERCGLLCTRAVVRRLCRLAPR